MDSDNKMGANAAILTDLYATDDTPAAVLDFYRRHLGHQWTHDDNAATRATQWSTSAAWESRDYLLVIGIDNAGYRSRVVSDFPDIAGRRTLFELQFQGKPKDGA